MWKVLRRLLYVVGVFLVFDFCYPLHTQIPYSTAIYASDSTVLYAFLAKDGQWRMPVEPSEITPELLKALLYKEDKYFYTHPGLNVGAITRAITRNLARGKRTSGASTISMQVVRLLEPRERTYFNKCIEMVRTLQLELHCSKKEILTLYLNLLPYGGNIQGVKAAALLYFQKSPAALSLAEITALSVIPNSPCSLVPGKANDKIIERRNEWLKRFEKAKLFSAAAIADAYSEPFEVRRHSAPRLAPQLAFRLRKANPQASNIYTTVNATTQHICQEIAENYISRQRMQNINNAAVFVINNYNHSVVSYVAGTFFNDYFHYGQVDGIKAVRSPGSTLKPFVYGMAMDKGLITPKYKIADIPICIKGYMPENYDKNYNGSVTTAFALSHSLNIPAVKVLDEVGLSNFLDMLASANFKTIKAQQTKLGLSAILGGCGVTLEELTSAYSALANEGVYSPHTFVAATGKQANETKPIRLLSQASTYLITDILMQLQRPDMPNECDLAAGIPRIAWKTGTSYGRKDAWSIGFNKKYTVGVWLGNFSAVGVPDLSGAKTATPLLFQIFNAIDHNSPPQANKPPATLDTRMVCAETGLPPAYFCNNLTPDYYLPGTTQCSVCEHLKEAWVNPVSNYCYCTACLPPTGYVTKLLPNRSPEMAAFLAANKAKNEDIPPHNPACTAIAEGKPPQINSLTNRATYIVIVNEKQKIPLACTPATNVEKVYWYVNDKFLTAAEPYQKVFFEPETGVVKITCADDKGRVSSIVINVKFI